MNTITVFDIIKDLKTLSNEVIFLILGAAIKNDIRTRKIVAAVITVWTATVGDKKYRAMS